MLIWLYPVDIKTRWVSYDELKFVLPDLSESGRQSLISYLVSKGEILTEKIGGELKVSLTAFSKKSLEEEFPAFSLDTDNWDSNWSLVCFLKSPKTDKNFRYLRNKLLFYKCIALSRGVFLFPGELPVSLTEMLNKLYKTSVTVLKAQKFVFGDELMIIGQKIGIFDNVELYSSISKELRQLLMKKTTNKGLTGQQKKHFFSLFSRLMDVFDFDYGLVKYYFPQEPHGREILFKMQTSFEL